MLYVFIGAEARKAALAQVKKMNTMAPIERVFGDSADPDVVRGSVGSSLFGEERVVFFEGVYSQTTLKEVLLGVAETLKHSADHFFIIEEKLLAADKKRIAAHAHEMREATAQSAKPRGFANNFAFADYFARHDKARAWVAYRRAIAEGESAEALHGILFWKVKDQLLKGVRDPKRDLKKTLTTLTVLPQKARERGGDVEHALELFLLS